MENTEPEQLLESNTDASAAALRGEISARRCRLVTGRSAALGGHRGRDVPDHERVLAGIDPATGACQLDDPRLGQERRRLRLQPVMLVLQHHHLRLRVLQPLVRPQVLLHRAHVQGRHQQQHRCRRDPPKRERAAIATLRNYRPHPPLLRPRAPDSYSSVCTRMWFVEPGRFSRVPPVSTTRSPVAARPLSLTASATLLHSCSIVSASSITIGTTAQSSASCCSTCW